MLVIEKECKLFWQKSFFFKSQVIRLWYEEKNIVSKIDQKKQSKHCVRNPSSTRTNVSNSQRYSGQSDFFPREYQLQSILTTAGTQPGPAVTLALPISECTLICLRLGSNVSALGVYWARWWIRHRSSSTSWTVLTLARH